MVENQIDWNMVLKKRQVFGFKVNLLNKFLKKTIKIISMIEDKPQSIIKNNKWYKLLYNKMLGKIYIHVNDVCSL